MDEVEVRRQYDYLRGEVERRLEQATTLKEVLEVGEWMVAYALAIETGLSLEQLQRFMEVTENEQQSED